VRTSLKMAIGSLIGAAGLSAGMAIPASAQPVTQHGLVNVNLTDVAVQVPVAVAANVCDVNVAVLVGTLTDTGSAPCTASANPSSAVTFAPGSGPTNQTGLINVNISDLVVQVPIGVAANICDVNAGVLVGTLTDLGAAPCTATGTPGAITTIG
jgi:hypothetical protein